MNGGYNVNITIDTHNGDASVDIASLTVAQMKAYAVANNIDLGGLTKK